MFKYLYNINIKNIELGYVEQNIQAKKFWLKNGFEVDIRTIPSVVGGDEKQRKGVVLAKSFPAKKKGIITGEPIYQARRKVDKLLVVAGARDKYSYYSDEFYKILCKYSPVIERYSIDECFMDMTGMELLYDDPVKLAYQIKDEIYKELGFTVNVGIGNSKLCAKMASDFEKPDKVHTLLKDEVKEKLWPLEVGKLFMVGKKTASKLKSLGIKETEIKELSHKLSELNAEKNRISGLLREARDAIRVFNQDPNNIKLVSVLREKEFVEAKLSNIYNSLRDLKVKINRIKKQISDLEISLENYNSICEQIEHLEHELKN